MLYICLALTSTVDRIALCLLPAPFPLFCETMILRWSDKVSTGSAGPVVQWIE